MLIASRVVGDDNGNANGHDAFPAVRAWLYRSILGAAYMVSRGLAKAGSRDPYWVEQDDPLGGNKWDRTTINPECFFKAARPASVAA